jgi:electron transfer flavoprotein alpha subunit
MTIACVLPRPADPAGALCRDLVAPLGGEHNRLERWIPGPDPWDPRHIEACLPWLEGRCAERKPGLVLFPGTPEGHELAARLAARLGAACYPETRALRRKGERLFARRKVCGSNLYWDAEITDYPAVLTLTGGGGTGGKAALGDAETGFSRTEGPPAGVPGLPAWLLEYERFDPLPANPLETAPLIFAAGRGLGSRAACERLRRVAGGFGAPLGFSRPAALNGWGETRGIIGQSGLRTGAELCVAVGVSGAAAFMAGIETVSTLIAVNPDKNAPIFRYADVGIIAGAEEFIAALEGETGNP